MPGFGQPRALTPDVFKRALWLLGFQFFSLYSAMNESVLKYYSPVLAEGKTFVLVFCVLLIVSTQLITRCKWPKTRTKVLPSETTGE